MLGGRYAKMGKYLIGCRRADGGRDLRNEKNLFLKEKVKKRGRQDQVLST